MRSFLVTFSHGTLTHKGQRYVVSIDGKEVYTGYSPFYGAARSMVDKYGYELTDTVTFQNLDGSLSPTMLLNNLYWTEVSESDKGGLSRKPWRGMTQDGISSRYRATKDGQED